MLQAVNNQATIMKLRSDMYKTINFDVIKLLLLKLNRKAKDLPITLCAFVQEITKVGSHAASSCRRKMSH
jgi:hypothetical protein